MLKKLILTAVVIIVLVGCGIKEELENLRKVEKTEFLNACLAADYAKAECEYEYVRTVLGRGLDR